MSVAHNLGRYIDHLAPDCRGIGPLGDHVVAYVLLEAPAKEIGQQHAVVIHGIRGETFEGQDLAPEVLDGAKGQLILAPSVVQADDAMSSGVVPVSSLL